MGTSQTAIETTPIKPKRNFDNVWKFVAATAVGIIIGMLDGQFQPNRQIVTQDQLNAEAAKIDNLVVKVDSMSSDLSEIKGEMKEQGKIKPQ